MIADASLADLVVLAAGVGFGVLVVVVGLYVFAVPRPTERRLAEYVRVYRPARADGVGRARAAAPDFLQSLDRRLQRTRQSSSTAVLLARGNVGMTYAEFMLLRIGLALAALAVATLELYGKVGLLAVAVGALAGLVGSYVPVAAVRALAARRLAAFEAQLPDALDLIAASLQAGGGMAQAISLITREMPPPISDEFRRVTREVEIGLSYAEALTNLVDRLGSDDLDLIVTVINVQSRVGGNLVQILRVINHTIRERVRIRGEVQVLTAMQRLSAFVISAIPPGLGLILWLMNHAYVERLFRPGIGEAMLISSVVMAFAGFLILQRIANIEV